MVGWVSSTRQKTQTGVSRDPLCGVWPVSVTTHVDNVVWYDYGEFKQTPRRSGSNPTGDTRCAPAVPRCRPRDSAQEKHSSRKPSRRQGRRQGPFAPCLPQASQEPPRIEATKLPWRARRVQATKKQYRRVPPFEVVRLSVIQRNSGSELSGPLRRSVRCGLRRRLNTTVPLPTSWQ